MKYDLILPVYNPKDSWCKEICSAIKRLNQLREDDIHVIIIDDGSEKIVRKDEFKELEELIGKFTFVSYDENKGKGHAIREACNYIRTTKVLFTDVDIPYSISSMLDVLDALESEENIFISGKRNKAYFTKLPYIRKIISRSFSKGIQLILGLENPETQVGLKAFQAQGINILKTTTIERYLFDLELFLEAERRNIDIKFVEVSLREGIEFSSMPISVLINELANFWYLFKKYRL